MISYKYNNIYMGGDINMNKMIQKFVDQGFMSESEGKFIEEAIDRKESIVVSGHRSAGTRPLMAGLMAVAKSNYSSKQVKGFDDLEEDVEYLLIPGIPGIDFEDLIAKAMAKPETSFVTIKDPDNPYSLLKLTRVVFKETNDTSKVYQVLECVKEDDVPKLAKITTMSLNEKGRLQRVDFEG